MRAHVSCESHKCDALTAFDQIVGLLSAQVTICVESERCSELHAPRAAESGDQIGVFRAQRGHYSAWRSDA
jgi:hypothetical protein